MFVCCCSHAPPRAPCSQSQKVSKIHFEDFPLSSILRFLSHFLRALAMCEALYKYRQTKFLSEFSSCRVLHMLVVIVYRFVELKSSSNASSMLLSSKSWMLAIEGNVLLRASECKAGSCEGLDTGWLNIEIFREIDCDELSTGRTWVLIDKLSVLLGPK